MFAPIRDSVRDRGIEKLHRIRITDAFGSDELAAVLRETMSAAMGSLKG